MVDRRKFLKLGAVAAAAPLVSPKAAKAQETEILKKGGESYSHFSGTPLTAVPSICGQCPSNCAIIGYLDEGQLVKIEGHPDSIRNQGKVCAKGQAGAEKIYDPDRILTPLRRTGARGAGEWEQISWDTALGDLTARLKKLRDDGEPEKFVFHHGWIPDSAEKLIDDLFLPAYGTGSIIRQTCHGQSARWTAHELTWGGQTDSLDIDKTDFVLNFGSNVLEAHTNHVSLARRLALAMVERHLRMVTFDVRLSNTAAKSDQWVGIRPGTDLAVALAMCNVVMAEDLHLGRGEEFLGFCQVTEDREAPLATKVAALKAHLADYTPEWAEEISGVPAAMIADIAREFATASSACVISSRGAAARFNGVETERAIQMLAAITGNIDAAGGRCRAVTPQWIFPTAAEPVAAAKKLTFIDNAATDVALPEIGDGLGALARLKAAGDGPGVYMWYFHNPAYTGANTAEIDAILKDEGLMPFTVAVTPFYDETAALADLILPDVTYMERYDVEAGVSPDQVPEYALRQPLVEPLGGARDFKDVCIELAERLEIPLGFDSGEDFVEAACKLTPEVKKGARGFKGLKKRGVWHDKKAEPVYGSYRKEIAPEVLAAEEVILDPATGVYWNWQIAGLTDGTSALATGYAATPGAATGYVGQSMGGAVYEGFAPGKLNKSGYFELYSAILAGRGQPGLPQYMAIPEHGDLSENQLILTTYKSNVQTMSSTGNSSWLSEIEHDNSAWINPLTAEKLAVIDGDSMAVKSRIGEIVVVAKVTPAIAPGVVAISTHAGRWAGGRYAAGQHAPFAFEDDANDALKWWKSAGSHANRIIPVDREPISGQQRWMDTVVEVSKAAGAQLASLSHP